MLNHLKHYRGFCCDVVICSVALIGVHVNNSNISAFHFSFGARSAQTKSNILVVGCKM